MNPDGHFVDTATIGIAGVAPGERHHGVGTAIVKFAMEWASSSGYLFCAVEWTSPNLTSDRFWRSRGFQPLQYKLTRRIDPRIAWRCNGLLNVDHAAFDIAGHAFFFLMQASCEDNVGMAGGFRHEEIDDA